VTKLLSTAARHTPDTTPIGALLFVAVFWFAVAVVIYEPFSYRPLELLDFSEFLPILREEVTVWSKLSRFIEYYACRGRINVGSYALFILNYSLFSDNPIGWQIMRLLQFALASVLLFIVLRRIGASVLGAGAATVLTVCAQSAAHAWVRPTASEPIGLSVFLGMLLVALNFERDQYFRRRIVLLCVLVILLVAFKEVFVATVPAVLAVALWRNTDGHWRPLRLRRAHVELLIAVGATLVACAIPILVVAAAAPNDSYSSLYGSGAANLGTATVSYLTALLPFVPFATRSNAGLWAANVAIYLLVTLGWHWYHRSLVQRGNATWPLTFLLAMPMLGSLSYLPWPNYQAFYAFLYLLTPAAIIALSLTGYNLRGRRATLVGILLYAAPFIYMATSAHEQVRRSNAELQLSHDLLRNFSNPLESDSVLFARSSGVQREWFGFGATLARQAAADGRTFPNTIDVTCDSAVVRLNKRIVGTRIVVRQSHCGSLGQPNASMTRHFRRFDWTSLRVVIDSVRADIFGRS
jgi:hypothetical protein